MGVRGRQAQLRILDAALVVFGEVGYHGCGVKRITEVSGCSRASFYQYFSSKEDLFRHLAGRVVRELDASLEALQPITADLASWQALHGWLARQSEIYEAYRPVFHTFPAAAESDPAVSSGATRVAARTLTSIRSRVQGSPLTTRQLDGVVRTLIESVTRANRLREVLEAAAPAGRAMSRARLDVALADVFHRALFGVDSAANVHTPKRRARPSLAAAAIVEDDTDAALGPGARRTRSVLLEAGLTVFVDLGFYEARVDDIVTAADVSHGVFYRYFANKTELLGILAQRAGRRLSDALDELAEVAGPSRPPGDDADDARRGWLRSYASTCTQDATIIAMWTDAMARHDELGPASAASVEHLRVIVTRFLEPRGFGDVDADAIVLLVLLDAITAQRPTPSRIETFAQIIERGLLTPPAAGAPARRPSATTSATAKKAAAKRAARKTSAKRSTSTGRS